MRFEVGPVYVLGVGGTRGHHRSRGSSGRTEARRQQTPGKSLACGGEGGVMSTRGSQDSADWWMRMAVCRDSGCRAGKG